MMLWSQSALLSAGVLAVAGCYQLSPLKLACLHQCRSPAQFLTQRWRAGRSGALRMGIEHGVWCVGCCWLLMALLFVGGVMNLVWIAFLAVLVLIEKLLPAGTFTSRASGAVLLAWSIATLLVR
jgi:predicted metal-binding membrane protein